MEQSKLRQILFPDMHSAQETIRTLWDINEGYGNTSRAILRLDEARGMGSFLSESTTVHNSHGTDVDRSHDETERMPLNKLADTVEQKIRPAPQK